MSVFAAPGEPAPAYRVAARMVAAGGPGAVSAALLVLALLLLNGTRDVGPVVLLCAVVGGGAAALVAGVEGAVRGDPPWRRTLAFPLAGLVLVPLGTGAFVWLETLLQQGSPAAAWDEIVRVVDRAASHAAEWLGIACAFVLGLSAFGVARRRPGPGWQGAWVGGGGVFSYALAGALVDDQLFEEWAVALPAWLGVALGALVGLWLGRRSELRWDRRRAARERGGDAVPDGP